jgi:uncharacterized protein (DUF305 family)
MKGFAIVAAVVLALAAAAAFALRGLAPTPGSLAANAAFTAANNKMMAGMMGNAVVYTGDADVDFVNLMLPHHQGAIDMAEIQLKYGRDAQIKELAMEIIAGQRPEMALMETWRKGRIAAIPPDAPAAKAAYETVNAKMMDGMGVHTGDGHSHESILTGNTDRDFVTMMIPHHQGAIEMAEVQLKYGKDPEIRALSEKIIAAQKAEIAEMTAWLGGAPVVHHPSGAVSGS